MTRFIALFVLIALSLLLDRTHAADLPPIPVGEDAYRQWDHWPYQRIGMRAYMRSTYDRTGGNEGADASHFLFQRADDFNAAIDVKGAGVLTFARFNHWHGSPWHFVVDGTDTVVQESNTADPTHRVKTSSFIPQQPFPEPLAWTWSKTHGSDLSWVPIPFMQSLTVAYSRTRYGTGYFIYDQFVKGTALSKPIDSWNVNHVPSTDVCDLLNRSGTDIAPPASPTVPETSRSGLTIHTAETTAVETIAPGHPSMLRLLGFSAPKDQALAFGRMRLRITWDDAAQPSIDAPLALFFGTGTLFNRDGREFLVKAFPMTVRFDADRVYLNCYFPMPFFKSARIELLGNGSSDVTDVTWTARYETLNAAPSQVGYFHATYHDHPHPEHGHDLLLLDTQDSEGGGDWSGSFVGTSLIFSDRANLGTLEGDPRFFFDDSRTPQAQGTGTEEWCGGGDYWGGENMTLPLAGHPTGAKGEKTAVNDEDKIESAYRFLLADLMPFGKHARICLEHGATDQSTEHYQTIAYWYGRHGATLVKTDTLQLGDAQSEASHHYASTQASPAYAITSRYELGPDSDKKVVFYPEETDHGRKTTGTSEFTLNLDPQNVGVMLRRKLDYSFPNQQARVSIAPLNSEDWKDAGLWYTAGSNTCVYSNPKDELGATVHTVETSNRRFRDDEFLLPLDLTAGRAAIRVRIIFEPTHIPLFPGRPLDEEAWSEIRYDAYSFVNPKD